jgi:hypothetical protein
MNRSTTSGVVPDEDWSPWALEKGHHSTSALPVTEAELCKNVAG